MNVYTTISETVSGNLYTQHFCLFKIYIIKISLHQVPFSKHFLTYTIKYHLPISLDK